MSSAFRCEICSLTLNSNEQYQQHLKGKNHAKKLKMNGLPAYVPDPVSTAPRVYGGKFVAAATMVPTTEGYVLAPANQTKSEQPSISQDPPISQSPVQAPSLPPVRTAPKGFVPPPPPHVQEGIQLVQPESVDPVAKAVMDNALGRLPLKRKLYSSHCDVCNISFNSEQQEQQHLAGGKHAKKLRLSDMGQNTITKLRTATFTCTFCNLELNSQEQMDQHRSGSKHMKKVADAKRKQTEHQKHQQTMKHTTTTVVQQDFSNFVPPPLTSSS